MSEQRPSRCTFQPVYTKKVDPMHFLSKVPHEELLCDPKILYVRFGATQLPYSFLVQYCPLTTLAPEKQFRFTNQVKIYLESDKELFERWNLTTLRSSDRKGKFDIQLLKVLQVGSAVLLFTRSNLYQYQDFDLGLSEPDPTYISPQDFLISGLQCLKIESKQISGSQVQLVNCYASSANSIYNLMYTIAPTRNLTTPTLIPVTKIRGRVTNHVRDFTFIGDNTVLIQNAVFNLTGVSRVIDAKSVAEFSNVAVASLKYIDESNQTKFGVFTIRVPSTLVKVPTLSKNSTCFSLLKECSIARISMTDSSGKVREVQAYHVNQNLTGVLPRFENKSIDLKLYRKKLRLRISDYYLGFISRYKLSILQNEVIDINERYISNTTGFLTSPKPTLSEDYRFILEDVPNCYKLHICTNSLSVATLDLTRLMVYTVREYRRLRIYTSPISTEKQGLFSIFASSTNQVDISLNCRADQHVHLAFHLDIFVFLHCSNPDLFILVGLSSNLRNYQLHIQSGMRFTRPRLRTIKKHDHDDILIIVSDIEVTSYKIISELSEQTDGFPNPIRLDRQIRFRIDEGKVIWKDFNPSIYLDVYFRDDGVFYLIGQLKATNQIVLGIFEWKEGDCQAIAYFSIGHPVFNVYVDIDFLWIIYPELMKASVIDLKDLYFQTEKYFNNLNIILTTVDLQTFLRNKQFTLLHEDFDEGRYFIQTIDSMVYLSMTSNAPSDPFKTYVLSLNMTDPFNGMKLHQFKGEIKQTFQPYGPSVLPGPIFAICSGKPFSLEYRILNPFISLTVASSGYSYTLETSGYKSLSYSKVGVNCRNPNSYEVDVNIRQTCGEVHSVLSGYVQNYSLVCADDPALVHRNRVWRYSHRKVLKCGDASGSIEQYVSLSQEVFKKPDPARSRKAPQFVLTSQILKIGDKAALLLQDKLYVVGLANYSRVLATIDLEVASSWETPLVSLSDCWYIFEGGFEERPATDPNTTFTLFCQDRIGSSILVLFDLPDSLLSQILAGDFEGKEEIELKGDEFRGDTEKLASIFNKNYIVKYRNGYLYVVEPFTDYSETSILLVYSLTPNVAWYYIFKMTEIYSSLTVTNYKDCTITSILLQDQYLYVAFHRQNTTSVTRVFATNPELTEPPRDARQNVILQNELLATDNGTILLVTIQRDFIVEYEVDFDGAGLVKTASYVYSMMCDAVSTKRVYKYNRVMLLHCQNSTEDDGVADDSILLYHANIYSQSDLIYPIQQVNLPDVYYPANLVYLFSDYFFILTSPNHLFVQYSIRPTAHYNITALHRIVAENVEERAFGQLEVSGHSIWSRVAKDAIDAELSFWLFAICGGWVVFYLTVKLLVFWKKMEWEEAEMDFAKNDEQRFEAMYNSLMNYEIN